MDVKAREGDLYRVIRVFGHEFELRYGYYDERERESRYGEPVPIYPDFHASPHYTADGCPLVTAMQNACEHYEGGDREDGCHGCRYYEPGEEFLGVCRNERRRPNNKSEYTVTNQMKNNSEVCI